MKLKILAFVLTMFYATTAQALELLMFNNKHCGYCQIFVEEVAPYYKYKDHSGKDLPLIIIDAFKQPDWFREAVNEGRIKPIWGTPTFIIWNGRKELVRIVGYSGKRWFYERLDEVFQK